MAITSGTRPRRSLPALYGIALSCCFFPCPLCDPVRRSQFSKLFAQGIYWAVAMLASINIMAQGYALGYANREDPLYLAAARTLNHWMWVDLAVKGLGMILAIVLNYPPIAMGTVLVAAIIPSAAIRYLNREFEA